MIRPGFLPVSAMSAKRTAPCIFAKLGAKHLDPVAADHDELRLVSGEPLAHERGHPLGELVRPRVEEGLVAEPLRAGLAAGGGDCGHVTVRTASERKTRPAEAGGS